MRGEVKEVWAKKLVERRNADDYDYYDILRFDLWGGC
jgi:hypothetical protein